MKQKVKIKHFDKAHQYERAYYALEYNLQAVKDRYRKPLFRLAYRHITRLAFGATLSLWLPAGVAEWLAENLPFPVVDGITSLIARFTQTPQGTDDEDAA